MWIPQDRDAVRKHWESPSVVSPDHKKALVAGERKVHIWMTDLSFNSASHFVRFTSQNKYFSWKRLDFA